VVAVGPIQPLPMFVAVEIGVDLVVAGAAQINDRELVELAEIVDQAGAVGDPDGAGIRVRPVRNDDPVHVFAADFFVQVHELLRRNIVIAHGVEAVEDAVVVIDDLGKPVADLLLNRAPTPRAGASPTG